MKWHHKKKKPAKSYKDGDLLFFKKFAFLPTRLDDGFTVWLEFYELIEKLQWVENRTLGHGDCVMYLGPGLKACYHKTKSLK